MAEGITDTLKDAINIFECVYDVRWWVCSFGQHAYSLIAIVLPFARAYLPFKHFLPVKTACACLTALLVLNTISFALVIATAICMLSYRTIVRVWLFLVYFLQPSHLQILTKPSRLFDHVAAC
jgi:hypothetical protein